MLKSLDALEEGFLDISKKSSSIMLSCNYYVYVWVFCYSLCFCVLREEYRTTKNTPVNTVKLGFGTLSRRIEHISRIIVVLH